MSLLSTIKKILPGSSRSLHAMHEDMDRRFDEVSPVLSRPITVSI